MPGYAGNLRKLSASVLAPREEVGDEAYGLGGEAATVVVLLVEAHEGFFVPCDDVVP